MAIVSQKEEEKTRKRPSGGGDAGKDMVGQVGPAH
jgi:hypothetical protein